ncbi:glycosyl hydrolase family 16 [Litoribaculum gwangyangense]|uniref:Glycosyl hydrolase family 16 n=1 Tax=Litoribaculum gwangyangense TaxID=1130722 RepID=A0ABP9CMS5_9FLAO
MILNRLKITLFQGFIFCTIFSCEREVSEDAVLASFPKTGEVFMDGFSSGLEYAAFGNSKFTAFEVDTEVAYKGSASMRFDVPNAGDPLGPYAGGTFRDLGGRDLSGYDALTFWIKSSQAGTINDIGFGNDFETSKNLVSLSNLRVGTKWAKVIIPLPEPSQLKLEKGLFWYAEGPENGDGYTFWIDELKFEKLETLGQFRTSIYEGEDKSMIGFVNSQVKVDGLIQTVNLDLGIDQTTQIAPSYFDFYTSDTNVATVNDLGIVSIHNVGNAKITATFNGKEVPGSLTIEAIPFETAPDPEYSADSVISVYSDAYNNINVDYLNGYWQPYQTTESSEITINGNSMINYTKFNFVGVQFTNPTIDATNMRYMHIDLYTTTPIIAPTVMYIDLIDFNPPNSRAGAVFNSTVLVSQQWMSLEIDLNTLGLARRDRLAQIVLNSASTLNNIYVDNIYFHN